MEPKVFSGLRRIERFLSLTSSTITLLLMAIIVTYVALRFLHRPFPGVVESSQLLMVMVVFFGLAHTQAQGMNIRVEMVLERLRSRFWLELFALLVGLTIWSLILWQSSLEAWAAWVTKEYDWGLIQFPTWPSKWVVPVGSFMLCTEVIIEIIELIHGRLQGTR